uniref:DUF148 domain-containing protein n=1 Tax=Musca domestica TaxID=7370 RepID=A0A1I8MX59_MUSDO
MRTVLTIFIITVIVQVYSIDAYHLRFRRSTYIEQNVQELFQFAKNIVNDSGPMINAVIEAMPDTEDYEEYRGELENYLSRLDEYKENSGMCAKKSIELMVSFMDVMMPYAEEEEEISPQAKEVLRLLSENGLLNLQQQAEKWMENFDDEKLQEEYETWSKNDMNNMTSIWTEIC